MTTEVVLFSKAEAVKFSAEIRKRMARASHDVEDIKRLVAEAEEREAWRALGFRSMAAYARLSLGMSRSNTYRVLDQVHALLLTGPQESVPRGTSETPLPAPSQREAERIMAPLKQRRPKRGIPDKTSVINAISAALDNYEAKADGYEAEEIMAYMSHDERRALERAVGKAGTFAETWGDLLTRPIERRYIEESA